MAKIVSTDKYIEIDDTTSIALGDNAKISKISTGVRVTFMSGSYLDINWVGSTVDGAAVKSADDLYVWFKSKGFSSGGSGPGSEPSWGSIVGDIDDQEDLIDYIVQHGGEGGYPRLHDYVEGMTYDKDAIVVAYEHDIPAIYRSLSDSNKTNPLHVNPWIHVGNVSDFSDWDVNKTYSKGDKAKYLYAGSFVVLIEALINSPGNPEESLFQEWKSLGVLYNPEEWGSDTEYSPLDHLFHTSVSLEGSYYSTSTTVKGISPIQNDLWEKIKEVVLDDNSFREIEGKIYIGLDPNLRLPDPNENSNFALGSNRANIKVDDYSSGIYSSGPDTIDNVNHSTSSVGAISTDENRSSSFLSSNYYGADSYIRSNINSLVTSTEASINISSDVSDSDDSSVGKFSSTLSLSSTNDHSVAKLGVGNKDNNEISLTASREGFKIKDSIFNRGVEYNEDYSEVGEKSDRWIPDWAAVKNQGVFKQVDSVDGDHAFILRAHDNVNNGISYEKGAVDLSLYRSATGTATFGQYSLTFGNYNTNGGWESLVGGSFNTADSVGGLTMGFTNENIVDNSAVFGEANIVKAKGSLVIGRGSTGGMEDYSRSWVDGNPVFVVGNGTQANPKDSYILYNDGKTLQWGVAKYSSKMHDDYDDRTLVDKEYVDNIDLDDVTGSGNITGNAIQITGGANADYETDGMILKVEVESSHVMNIVDAEQSGGLIIGDGKAKLYANGNETNGIGLDIDSVNNISKFNTRVSGIDAKESDEFVTKHQLDSKEDVVGAVDVSDPDVVSTAIAVTGFGNDADTTYSEGAVDFAVSRSGANTLGKYSFRAGKNSIASGKYSAAFGNSKATDENAFASGQNSEASGIGSLAIGMFNKAQGMNSVAIGSNNVAASSLSNAFGNSNTSYYYGEMVIGRLGTVGPTETSYNANSPAFRVGAGISDTNRIDSYIIYNNGKSLQRGIAEYSGNLHDQYTDRSMVDKEFVLNLIADHFSTSQRSAVNDLVAPVDDFADMSQVTAAIRSIINALQA